MTSHKAFRVPLASPWEEASGAAGISRRSFGAKQGRRTFCGARAVSAAKKHGMNTAIGADRDLIGHVRRKEGVRSFENRLKVEEVVPVLDCAAHCKCAESIR